MEPIDIVKNRRSPSVVMDNFLVRLAICAALALNAALLAGCALMQPTDPYGPVPGFHRGRLDRQISRHPATPGVPTPIQEPLTIALAVKIALANNPEIAATQWDVAAAENRYQAARAGHWPSLSAEGGYGRFLDPQRLIQARYNGEPGVFDNDIYRADLVLKLPLFAGGRITNEVRAADLLRLSEERRLARSWEELVFNVSSTFYALLSQREVIRSLEFSITAMAEHRRQVSDLLAVQKAARVDLLRTEVRLADLRQGVGILLLFSIIIKNSILLIDFYQEFRRKNESPFEAAMESVRVRFRPVFMTAFGTIAGMIPIAFEWAVGLERLSPLADVAVGGLLVGTVLTLIYIPMFAYSVEGNKTAP
jgi:hypothetical protein